MSKKSIATLSEDIYNLLDKKQDHTPDEKMAAASAMRIGGEFAIATLRRDKPRELGRLWASDLGKPCRRQQWYSFNEPDKAEPMQGHTQFKFLYGNIIEEAVLYLAEEAGHSVLHKQEQVEWEVSNDWTIRGRIDAIIDGVLVDVKSTSSYGFKRYKDGITPNNDTFGYLDQLGFYKRFGNLASNDQGFIWIDKQNGHIKYTRTDVRSTQLLTHTAYDIIQAVELPTESMVPKGFTPKPYGKSGNQALDISCSYCPYKKHCWRHANNGAGLRTFAYNHGPVHFTDITREPKVPELVHFNE